MGEVPLSIDSIVTNSSWGNEPGASIQILNLVGKREEATQGFLSAELVTTSDPDGEMTLDQHVYLATVFVPEELRGRGIGPTLIAEMEKQAQELGAVRVEGTIVSPDLEANPDLPDFYDRLGYELTPYGSGYRIVKTL